MTSKFGPPFYYSYDDGHNRPYISGPWTEEELAERIGEGDLEELLEFGYTDDCGEEYELHTYETVKEDAEELMKQAEKIKAGEKLP